MTPDGGAMSVELAELEYTQSYIDSVADMLEKGVGELAHRVSALLDSWDGVMSNAYRTEWDEWYDGARSVVDALRQSIQALAMAKVAYSETEETNASTLGSIYVPLRLPGMRS